VRRRPAFAASLFAAVLLVVVAFGVRAAGTTAPEAATEVPTSIPVNGVNINTQVVLLPTSTADVPALTEPQAISAAGADRHKTLVPPTAILARVTAPGTIPPPDSPVPFRTIQDRLAWVVTGTFDKAENVNLGRGGPLMVTHYSAVIDADSGEFLIGFYTA
jgi:hypothetical protein